jgi:glucose/arabinose dehydrogenase
MRLLAKLMLAATCISLLINCGGGGAVGGGGNGGNGGGTQPLALDFTEVVFGLVEPTVITHAGDASGRLFLVEQPGRVRILSTGTLLPTPFLDISARLVSGGEQGLLGLAFPPGPGPKDHFFVYYTRATDGAGVLSRFTVSLDPDLAAAASEDVLLTVPQPFANHNGGQLAFGPLDGYLYLGLGDGGDAGDPQGHGQNPATLLGSLLRLDVESGTVGYAVPADNPFVGNPGGADEVWAYGLRNPWRFSFDRLTGDLYLGDVGQAAWEEINWQPGLAPGGDNYGWNTLEADACFNPPTGCLPPANYVAPVASYAHSLGSAVTGGYVYRGPGNPGLQGIYFYGDFGSGRIWSLQPTGSGFTNQLLNDTAFSISTFGEDEAGNLYLADYATGTIYRIDQQ